MDLLAGHTRGRVTVREQLTGRLSRFDPGVRFGTDLSGLTRSSPRLSVWLPGPARDALAYVYPSPEGAVMACRLEPAWLEGQIVSRLVVSSPACPACTRLGVNGTPALYLIASGGVQTRFFAARCHTLAEVPVVPVPGDQPGDPVAPLDTPAVMTGGEPCDPVHCAGLLLSSTSGDDASVAPLSVLALYCDARGRERGWERLEESVARFARSRAPRFASRAVGGRLYRGGHPGVMAPAIGVDLGWALEPMRISGIRGRIRHM
jgi:hypothetical protein